VHRDDALADAVAEYKRSRAALIGVVGVGVGLALGLGLGVGLGGNFALVGAFGSKRVLAAMASPPERLSARERVRLCTMSDFDDVPGPEEQERMWAWRKGQYPEPKLGVP
jgi:hypothetical protein